MYKVYVSFRGKPKFLGARKTKKGAIALAETQQASTQIYVKKLTFVLVDER